MTVTSGAIIAVNGVQASIEDHPSIVALANGGWVVNWVTNNSITQSQRFNADGSMNGAQISVDTGLSGYGISSAALPDGGWIVTYNVDIDPSAWTWDNLYQQRYNANGTTNGPAVQVNLDDGGRTFVDSSVAALAGGGWVVTRSDFNGQSLDIVMQRYNADGSKRDGAVVVSGPTDYPFTEIDSEVAALADGGWVVAFTNNYPYTGDRTYIQIYNADGTRRGGNTPVDAFDDNPANLYHLVTPSVTGLENGGFVVTYSARFENSVGVDPYFVVFNAAGTKLTDRIFLYEGVESQYAQAGDYDPAVAALDNGMFVVTWTRGALVHMRLFDEDGNPHSGIAEISNGNNLLKGAPSIAALPDAGSSITWTENHDIKLQSFHCANGAPAGTDRTVQLGENGAYTFQASDFGFVDYEKLSGVVINDLPDSGSLKLNGIAVIAGELIAVGDILKLTWAPDAGDWGSALDTLKFSVKDNGGTANGGKDTDTTPNTITFDVIEINKAPTSHGKVLTIDEDNNYNFSAADFGFSDSAQQSGPDGMKGIRFTDIGSAGPFSLYYRNAPVIVGDLIPVENINDLFMIPGGDYFGTGIEMSFVVVDDGGTTHGGKDTSVVPSTFTFDVQGVNDRPRGESKDMSIAEDTDYRFSISDFGFSPGDGEDDALKEIVISWRANGTFKLDGVTLAQNATISADQIDQLVFKGAKDNFGPYQGSIGFWIVDDGGTERNGVDTAEEEQWIQISITDVVDKIKGTGKSDRLVGTKGNDILDGKAGNDRLTGGDGNDTVVFKTGYDKDRIIDFYAMGELIDISGLKSVSNFRDLMRNHLHETRAGVVINGGKGDVLTLLGVDKDDIDRTDFIFEVRSGAACPTSAPMKQKSEPRKPVAEQVIKDIRRATCIPGLREIGEVKAAIVIRIFKEDASGVSPRDIAKRLNAEDIDGPRGLKWRDTAIRGHVSRGTGILNNEIYLGRMIWNKQNYRKTPESERRTARANATDQWVTKDVLEMRIVSDQLWASVKKRQAEVGELFTRPSSNPLNGTHLELYLLSSLPECAECGGLYAISGKDRYSCTNHRKALPIDALGGMCCSNTKTILRKNARTGSCPSFRRRSTPTHV